MANLFGRIKGSRGEATRTGSDTIEAHLETWEGRVTVELQRNGDFTVWKSAKNGMGEEKLLEDNCNER